MSTTVNISVKNSDCLNTGMMMFLIFTEDRTRTLPIQMWAPEDLCCVCIKGWRRCSIGQLRARKLSVTNYGTGTCQMKNSTWRRNCSWLTTPCNELNHKTLSFQLIMFYKFCLLYHLLSFPYITSISKYWLVREGCYDFSDESYDWNSRPPEQQSGRIINQPIKSNKIKTTG